VRHLRSVGTRLTLALALVVAGALGVVYVIVVPSLKRNLVNAKISQLHQALPAVVSELGSGPVLQDQLQVASASASARVVVYEVLTYSPPRLQVFDDSRGGASSRDVESDAMALAALTSGREARGTVERGETRFAEVARPVGRDVVLLSASLHDALANVRLVQRRVLAAGLLALAVAVLVGIGAATMFARRIRRLEAAAERIASGDLGEPVEDGGRDELGELAAAFERMRQRLGQLDDARRAFIANASHELRTPLFSLGGFLELLDDEELDEATRQEFLAEMGGQVDRLQKLAIDLLDLSRLDAGKLRIEAEPVELMGLAESLARELRPRAARGDRHVDVQGTPLLALADEERVRQIGRIFVDNALVHTPPGTPVRICVCERGRRVELAVEDEGPGIPAEARERVFERFSRVDGTVASGSGLGLAIARELAALMDGAIELDVRPDRTAFRLVLPAAAGEPFSRENVHAETAPLQ
jgi:two-component system, OmpR family, sensor kinase